MSTIITENKIIRPFTNKKNQKGILFADVDVEKPDHLIIGFSIATKKDMQPYFIEGIKEGGWNREKGVSYAVQRAIVHRNTECVHLCKQKVIGDKSSKTKIVIPSTVVQDLLFFVSKCEHKFPGMKYPAWVELVKNTVKKPKTE